MQVTLEELKRKKEEMDIEFEKNRKKPGDPDFVYNIEVDFDGEKVGSTAALRHIASSSSML